MIHYFKELIDFILHIDKYLNEIILQYGFATYLILFLIIFVETGLVIMPLLPGDSLLFAAGTFAYKGSLNIYYLIILLFIAAVLGDTLNYFIGKYIGPKVFSRDYKLIKRSHLQKTQDFYEKHGGKTIILARFIPIVRTFAPFVAGIGNMNYMKFISYNIIGGAIWVVGLTLLGYYFGQLDFVQKHFETVVLAIIFISILPPIIEILRAKFQKTP
ncbi:MAG: DedA family protein [Cytophagales bacterium]|nr:MAG: DedA family protein [Cytophagales bacterium]